MDRKLALVVLSGGQDSTTCLALAIQKYASRNVRAITFDYGQRHRVEIDAARHIARIADVGHEVVSVGSILAGTSPLVNPSAEVESYGSVDVLPGGLEKTFVPMRNQLFLTIAANRAAVWAMAEGVDTVEVWTGVSQEDYGGYPDCREDFILLLERAIRQSLNDPGLPRIEIEAPLMHLSKLMTVKLSEVTPYARYLLGFSHTCYNGQVPPCGKCHACLLRERGYKQAGVTDPLLERLASL